MLGSRKDKFTKELYVKAKKVLQDYEQITKCAVGLKFILKHQERIIEILNNDEHYRQLFVQTPLEQFCRSLSDYNVESHH